MEGSASESAPLSSSLGAADDDSAAPPAVSAAEAAALDAAATRQLDRHLLPWLYALALLCYIDRANLAFAALQMQEDAGIDDATYGLGASIFFITYTAFQVPSQYALMKVGAPLWLARISVSWGAVSTLFAFVSGPTSFLALRFALGLAESGTFPAIYYYMTRWYNPPHHPTTHHHPPHFVYVECVRAEQVLAEGLRRGLRQAAAGQCLLWSAGRGYGLRVAAAGCE